MGRTRGGLLRRRRAAPRRRRRRRQPAAGVHGVLKLGAEGGAVCARGAEERVLKGGRGGLCARGAEETLLKGGRVCVHEVQKVLKRGGRMLMAESPSLSSAPELLSARGRR